MQTQHVFRLKRNRPKEPLGLVLVSGEKNPEGITHNFYVKQVKKDTLGSKAGVEAGDRIVQIDNYDLCHILKQEAVARIKDKSVVTLTILRGGGPLCEFPPSSHRGRSSDHIYDEILYADLNPLIDENFPPYIPMAQKEFAQLQASHRMVRRQHQLSDDSLHVPRSRHARPGSPMATYTYKPPSGQSDPSKGIYCERGSKDSGLSSGSTGESPPPAPPTTRPAARNPVHPYPGGALDISQDLGARRSYHTEREMARAYLKKHQAGTDHSDGGSPPSSHRRRIDGDYEVEDVYIAKNGTSQLGLTLGYDSRNGGHLKICEILPTGLAYHDGRIKLGDIIRRVNGFEVYDPEEAILMFLEQDQDITLTLARKLEPEDSSSLDFNVDSRRGLPFIRRVDSCGSLDSHTHKYLDESSPAHQHGSHNELDHCHATGRAFSQSNLLHQCEEREEGEEGFRKRSAGKSHHTSPLSQPLHALQASADVPARLRDFGARRAGPPRGRRPEAAPRGGHGTTPPSARGIPHSQSSRHLPVQHKRSTSSVTTESSTSSRSRSESLV